MSDLSDQKCLACDEQLERLCYFPRQLLCAEDMRLEQQYFREKLRRHNRYLHGWGVVCGCAVEPVDDAKTPTVRVCPGYVVAPQGDDILINDCVDVDLKLGAKHPCAVRWPCPPEGEMPGGNEPTTLVHIAVRYAECLARPVRVHPAGCGCDESACEYSRARDSFEIKVLWKIPESHVNAAKDDDAWCTAVQNLTPDMRRRHAFPVPPCPECVTDPWVVLASVVIVNPPAGGPPALLVNYNNRRTLLATQRLQVAMLCLP